jgi:hypothetical protein
MTLARAIAAAAALWPAAAARRSDGSTPSATKDLWTLVERYALLAGGAVDPGVTPCPVSP